MIKGHIAVHECNIKWLINPITIFCKLLWLRMSLYITFSWRTARVFISSTFRDMHGERDLLTRYVFPELRALGKKHFINVYEVDLRWGVTEEETKNSRYLFLSGIVALRLIVTLHPTNILSSIKQICRGLIWFYQLSMWDNVQLNLDCGHVIIVGNQTEIISS